MSSLPASSSAPTLVVRTAPLDSTDGLLELLPDDLGPESVVSWVRRGEGLVGWGDSKTLDQHIRRLRRKLEQVDGSPTITTVRGVGYRLDG